MAVEKFGSVQEMNAMPVRENNKDALGRFFRHCARFQSFSQRNKMHGVFKFRSIEEAQIARQLSGNSDALES